MIHGYSRWADESVCNIFRLHIGRNRIDFHGRNRYPSVSFSAGRPSESANMYTHTQALKLT